MSTQTPYKILVVSFSQTGQLDDALTRFLQPLHQEHANDECAIDIEMAQLSPITPYTFPWNFFVFFNTFPETVHAQPAAIKPLTLKHHASDYDLIILAYTVWFLKPSQPISALLLSDEAKMLFANKPVITFVACRNMWLMAHETIKQHLTRLKAKHIEHIAVTDQAGTFASFITTPRWLLTGKKTPFMGLPAPGIAQQQLQQLPILGEHLKSLILNKQVMAQHCLSHLSPRHVNPLLLISEKAGTRSFYVWGKLILNIGKISKLLRAVCIYLYIMFLIGLIITVVPISLLIQTILNRLFPGFLMRRLKKIEPLAPSAS